MNSPRPRLDPATAETRRAVRTLLETARADRTVRDGDLVLVALSGGPDSLALAAATAFEAPKQALRAGAVIVDHALQDGSETVATRASRQAAELGLDPVSVRRVAVGSDGGPEAAAREARHASVAQAASDAGSRLVLFGHTLDDQAETVLLGLLRGSGPDSLSGMEPLAQRTDGLVYGRPFLQVRRHTTHQACVAAGLAPWHDPHNDDPAYSRVRVRNALMPALERELGAGVPEALARTADQLREDSAALDHFAEEMAEDIAEHSEAGISLSVRSLAANPPALRQRLVRLAVESEFGVTLTRVQTLEVCRLVTDWHGQGPIDLPGVRASRSGDRLAFSAG